MRKPIKKILCAALCLVLVLMPLTALGRTRLPAERGVVTDDANVLGAQTVSDIAAYAEKVKDATALELHVAVVHFLDGLDAQTYANELFLKWNLKAEDVLLLGAAGEDRFAAVMGETAQRILGSKNAENLLYTSSSFSTLFRSRQYDAAFDAYFTAFNALVEKQTDQKIKLGKLFASAQTQKPAAEPAPSGRVYGSQLWNEVMDAIKDSSEDYQQYHETREHTRNGLSAGGWIVLAILIAIVFGQSDPVRKARRNRGRSYRSYGCGCSPLGWIFSLIGVNVLIDAIRGRRR